MHTNKVDILMATYNGGLFLAEQVDSILRDQTYTNIHLYIRDDMSQDDTCAIIRQKQQEYPGRITLIPSEQRLGVVGNFSELMRHSSAEYVMFSDQDDIWLPEKVSQTLSAMSTLEQVHGRGCPLLVHTDLQVVDAKLGPIAPSFWKYTSLSGQRCKLNQLLIQNAITGCTVMINRALCSLAHPIPAEVVMHDWWIGLVASAMGHIGVVDHPTILYRQHGNNQMGARGFWGYYHQLLNPFHCHLTKLRKILHQGTAFSTRYQEQLNDTQNEMVAEFCRLDRGYPWHKAYRMYKHKFTRSHWTRTLPILLGLFFLKKH